MVSERDRAHFRAIAEAEAELNLESIRRAAHRTPAENLALAFALTRWVSTFAGSLDRPDEVAPIAVWLKRRRHRR